MKIEKQKKKQISYKNKINKRHMKKRNRRPKDRKNKSSKKKSKKIQTIIEELKIEIKLVD